MSKVNIDNINWKQYKIIDPLQGLSCIRNFEKKYRKFDRFSRKFNLYLRYVRFFYKLQICDVLQK